MTDVHLHVLHVPGADPDRDEIVARLRGTEGVSACVHADPHRKGLMQNWLSALVCAIKTDPTDQPWAYVLSDDADPAVPDSGWVDEMTAATEHAPEAAPFLGLTHFGSFGQKAVEKGAAYGVGPNLVWGGAIAYRRDVLPEFTRWASAVAQRTGYPHDDTLVVAYALRSNVPTAMTARAIFDQPITRSLLGHYTPIRRPYTTIADEGADWSEESTVRVNRSTGPGARRLAGEN